MNEGQAQAELPIYQGQELLNRLNAARGVRSFSTYPKHSLEASIMRQVGDISHKIRQASNGDEEAKKERTKLLVAVALLGVAVYMFV